MAGTGKVDTPWKQRSRCGEILILLFGVGRLMAYTLLSLVLAKCLICLEAIDKIAPPPLVVLLPDDHFFHR